MRTRLVIVLGLAALTGCAEDTLLRFSGPCRVALAAEPAYRTRCMLEDLKTPGFNNRFRLVIHNPRSIPRLDGVADLHRVDALLDGQVRTAMLLLGSIELTPDVREIRDHFRRIAPAWEVRPQRVTTRRLDDGSLEILWEEPYGDFYGHYTTESAATPMRPISPTKRWLDEWLKALAQYSNVK